MANSRIDLTEDTIYKLNVYESNCEPGYAPFNYLLQHSNSYYPISITKDGCMAIQNMLYLDYLDKDPFEYFYLAIERESGEKYSIDDIIKYYEENPRKLSFISKRTLTARANCLSNEIDIASILKDFKNKYSYILHTINSLLTANFYTENNYWNDCPLVNREDYDFLYYANTYSSIYPIFNTEEILNNIFLDLFENNYGKFIDKQFSKLDFTTNSFLRFSNVNTFDNKNTSYRDKRASIRYFINNYLRKNIYISIIQLLAMLLNTYVHCFLGYGALYNKSKDKNRVTYRIILPHLLNNDLLNDNIRYSTNIANFVAVFASMNITIKTIYHIIDGVLASLKPSVFNTVTIQNSKDNYIKAFNKLVLEFNNVKNVLQSISILEKYLYNKVFANSMFEKHIFKSVDDKKPMNYLIPKFISPLFTNIEKDKLDKLLFEKLYMSPIKQNNFANKYIIFSVLDNTTFNYIDENNSDNYLSFNKLVYRNKNDLEKDDFYGLSEFSSSLYNKILYFNILSDAISQQNLISSGIYTQKLDIKERVGIILFYLVLILNRPNKVAGNNGYRYKYAKKCPVDIGVYVKDK